MTGDEKAWLALPQEGRFDQRFPFAMNVTFVFLDASGAHNYEQLKDGLRDARWRLVNLVPVVPAFVVKRLIPKNKYVQIVPLTAKGYDWPVSGVSLPLEVEAWTAGNRLDTLKMTELAGTYFIKLSHLRKIRADRITVSGGPYRVQAQPSPRAIRRALKRHLKNLPDSQKALIEQEFFEPLEGQIETLEPAGEAPDEEFRDKTLEAEEVIRGDRQTRLTVPL